MIQKWFRTKIFSIVIRISYFCINVPIKTTFYRKVKQQYINLTVNFNSRFGRLAALDEFTGAVGTLREIPTAGTDGVSATLGVG